MTARAEKDGLGGCTAEHIPGAGLTIGYLWQYDGGGVLWPDDGSGKQPVSATAIHVRGVVEAFRRSGQQVRTVVLREGVPHWSDDLATWWPAAMPARARRSFRAFESAVRGVQARLRLPFVRLFDSYHFSDGCAAVLRGADVLYERYFILNYGGLIAARRLGVPWIVEVNGDLVEELVEQRLPASRAQWAAIRAITRLTLARADHVVAVSDTLRRRLIERWHVDPAKITAVPNGTDVDGFRDVEDGRAVRSRHSLGSGPVIVFVGNFMPWHGVPVLLEAFGHLVSANGTDATLALVGDGPLRAEMAAKASALGLGERVRFTGSLPHAEAAAILCASDIAVLCNTMSPTAMAGSPLKLFEYMAAGKTIVASALPHICNVLSDGHNGVLVPPDDPAALAAAVAALIHDGPRRASLGNAARAEAVAKHSWDRVAADLLDVCDRARVSARDRVRAR